MKFPLVGLIKVYQSNTLWDIIDLSDNQLIQDMTKTDGVMFHRLNH